jgi:hypothetical protein
MHRASRAFQGIPWCAEISRSGFSVEKSHKSDRETVYTYTENALEAAVWTVSELAGRQKPRGVITGGMPLTRLVHRASTGLVATLSHMETYHVLAAGTVLWLLASAGATDSHLPAVLTATLTAAALLLTHVVRRRKEKL